MESTYSNERRRVISGATVIKGNKKTGDNTPSNLCIESIWWERKRESFRLSDDAEVWISYREATSGSKPSNIVNDSVCDKYLQSDQEGYSFRFDIERRFINRVVGSGTDSSALTPVLPNNINNATGRQLDPANTDQQAGKVGVVHAGGAEGGGGDTYDKIRGFYRHEGDEDLSVFYYSDGLFYASPYTYNTHLGSLSLAFAYAGGYLNKSEDPDANGNRYYNKHAAARQFFADIGCSDQSIYVNDYLIEKPTPESIGVSIGSKELATADGKTGDILIAAAVRGFGYEAEWVSNVTLDSSAQMADKGKEAKGFSDAADKVTSEIEYYLKKYSLEDELQAGKVKFWITGYSRAGATANLTSKRLVDKIAKECKGEKKSEVFG